jgi:hypothetical protein
MILRLTKRTDRSLMRPSEGGKNAGRPVHRQRYLGMAARVEALREMRCPDTDSLSRPFPGRLAIHTPACVVTGRRDHPRDNR